jgi:hypothetical protein
LTGVEKPMSAGRDPEFTDYVGARIGWLRRVAFLLFGREHGFPNAVAVFAHHLKLLGTNTANWTTRPLG